jgi:hypothetical protein
MALLIAICANPTGRQPTARDLIEAANGPLAPRRPRSPVWHMLARMAAENVRRDQG